MEAFVRKTDE